MLAARNPRATYLVWGARLASILLLVPTAVLPCRGQGRAEAEPVHFRVAGKKEPALVFVHGWTCDASFWDRQFEEFATKYKVMALDLPGHGKSVAPRGGFHETTFAEALDAALRRAKIRQAILVGHSLGGAVIRQYARLHPRKVKGLVFVEAPFRFPDTPEMRAWPDSFAGAGGLETRRAFIALTYGQYGPAELRAEITEKMLSAPEATAVGAARWLVAPTTMRDEDRFSVPVLIIAHAGGRPLPDSARALFADVEYIEMQGVGHFLMMEKPDEFNKLLLQFLQKHR